MNKYKNQIYREYTDDEGLVTIDQFPGHWSTGNGSMHLGLFMCFLKALNILEDSDRNHFRNVVKTLEVEPGNYNRNVNRPDLIAQDDIGSISCGSVVTDNGFEKDIFSYGLKHLFFWNNTNKFEWSAFRGRFPIFIMSIALLAGRFLVSYPLIIINYYLFKAEGYLVMLSYMFLEALAYKYSLFKFVRNDIVPIMGLSEAVKNYFKETHSLYLMSLEVEKSKV